MNLLIISLLLFVFDLGLAQRPTSPPEKSCQPNPCMNGGTCSVTWGRVRCRCPAGYVGLRCERETVCATQNPCENGGRCYPGYSGGYRCRCQGDFGGQNCSEPNPCKRNPCQNGGTCSAYKTWTSYWRLSCLCPSSHIGKRCEIESPCKNFECMNGGRCFSLGSATARCHCVNGYWGQHCEKASVCSTEKPCKNGGSCYPTYNGNYRCRCQREYGGLNCTESDPCNSNPCQNGGTCSSYNYRGWQLICRCPKFYSGQKCEKEDPDPCNSNPCQNGGTCVSTKYWSNWVLSCKCPPNFKGRNCEMEDPCKASTCLNGGRCYSYGSTRARCICYNGYSGEHCEQAGVCAVENPCENGGTCYPGFNGGYRCRCQTNLGGKNCTESDPCNKNPCMNGGTCRSYKSWDSSWVQSCSCLRQYLGKNCEITSVCAVENPCKNGGTCYPGFNGSYRCRCQANLGGRNCTESDPCSRNICQNGGTCHSYKSWDSSWDQSCRCPSDYIGNNCETEDPCKRVTCLNGGRCYSYGTTSARCSCYGGYRGPRCEQEPCPISFYKCFRAPTPDAGDFDTCRKQVEESIKQRNSCFDRQIQEAIEKKICSCSESDFMGIHSLGVSHQVLSLCYPRINFGQSLPGCDKSIKQCAELGLTLVRDPSRLRFCNETLKTQMEGCMKKLEEGQLSFSGCGAYEYLIKEGSAMVYYPMLSSCHRCNLTDVMKCYSSMPQGSSGCKMLEGQNLNKTLDCVSTGLKESCTAGADRAIKGYLRALNEYYRVSKEGCAKASKHMEERAKWGCPTAAPTTPYPFITPTAEVPF